MDVLSHETGFNIQAKTPEDSTNAMLDWFLEPWRKQWPVCMKLPCHDHGSETGDQKLREVDILEGTHHTRPENQLATEVLLEGTTYKSNKKHTSRGLLWWCTG